MIKTQFNHSVKIIRSDNGPEFLMNDYYSSLGIIHQTSCVESPEQNGRVERKHQHLLNVGRALLFQSNLPKHFWSYAVVHATYIINRIATPVLKGKSPYEMMFNTLPDLNVLKVFGSLAYASTLQINKTKLSPRGRKCIYLGHKQGVKGIILYDLQTKDIFISRNVTHHDHILPYVTNSSSPKWNYYTTSPLSDILPSDQPSSDDVSHTLDNHVIDLAKHSLTNDHEPYTDVHLNDHNSVSPHIDTNTNIDSTSQHSNSPDNTIRHSRSDRVRHKPSYLSDYVCNSSDSSSNLTSSGTPYPISSFHSLSQLSDSHSVFTLSLTQHTEPKSYIEACKSEHWVKAMNS
jgi:hypothetical protein